MSLTTVTSFSIDPGTRLSSNADDADYLISTFAVLMSDDAGDPVLASPMLSDKGAVELFASHHDLEIRGAVSGRVGVRLGNDKAVDFDNDLVVTESGSVFGVQTAVHILGSGSVTNAGNLPGIVIGVFQELATLGSAVHVNSGVVAGTLAGYSFSGSEATTAQLTNTGTVAGSQYSYRGVQGVDTLRNTGTLIGDVGLSGGNDRFENVGGALQDATVFGGEGNDVFLLGSGAEAVNGGDGIDTVDYRGSAGVRVSLLDASSTGWAEGDSFVSIERVLGSAKGRDVMTGNSVANTLAGRGGNDSLVGGFGADSLSGGAGADWLQGGAQIDLVRGGKGNDVFVLAPLAGHHEAILDFRGAKGNDDGFGIDVGGFGGGLVAGRKLTTDQFVKGMSNEALDEEDRFLFRTTDATLWYDADGEGGAASVLIADLQDGAQVGAGDFLLF